MNSTRAAAAIGLFLVAALLAACGGGSTYTPDLSRAISTQESSMQDAIPVEVLPADIRDKLKSEGISAIPKCTATAVGVPGYTTLLIASGNVKSGTFTAVEKATLWEYLKLTKATAPPPTPTPAPTPTSSPTSGPTPPPMYYYYGTFKLKKGGNGCMYLFDTKSGKPLQGSTYNAEALGTQKIKAKYYHEMLVKDGTLTMKIKNLSSTGGKGAFALKTASGSTFNSGTVDLVGRILLK